MRNVELLIIGAGPTGLAGLAGLAGLGAAVRCLELGVNNFLMIERAEQAGGLASSFVDSKGFVWDLGSHLQFSHYDKFDDYMNLVLKRDEWLHHQRASYVWLDGDFIPYPFQHNLHHLPPETRWECISGLLPNGPRSCVANFEDWIYQTFGERMARAFFIRYNGKNLGLPAESHESRVGVRTSGDSILERHDPAAVFNPGSDRLGAQCRVSLSTPRRDRSHLAVARRAVAAGSLVVRNNGHAGRCQSAHSPSFDGSSRPLRKPAEYDAARSTGLADRGD